MLNTEQLIVACASCGTQYNVSTMAPGAKFKCQKCATINIVPAVEEPIQKQASAPPTPPPRPQVRPQTKAPVRTNLKPPAPNPVPATSKISGTRVPPPRVSAPLKKGRLSTTKTKEGEEGDMPATKTGIMAKENRKYLYIGGATLLVFLAVFYVVHSNSVAKRNDQIAEKATKAISEINEFVLKKDYVNALEKSEAFVREFKDSDVPEVKKNAEKTEISIKGITQQIEREKEGKSRLADLQNKKSNATPDQYEDLIKEFNKFMTKYGEFSYMFEKAKTESKDLEAKVAAKQEEEDNKIYSELMAEIKPMVDGGKIDDAITHLKKYWDNNKLDKRLQGALKKKLSELKSMK